MATREAIVDAALVRLHDTRPGALSYADIAADVGVGLRTVYRHFFAMDDLLGAALDRFLRETVGAPTFAGARPAELAAMFERIHARLSANPALYRLFFALPARTGVGMAAVVKEFCRDALEEIPRVHHDAVCAAVELMLTPYAWEVFHTHWGCPSAADHADDPRLRPGAPRSLRRPSGGPRSSTRAPADVS